MDKPSFVYTTYIHTTPERLWEALTSPAFTQRYWNAAFETDWTPGSEMVWNLFGVRVANPEQVVLEAEPPRRLSYTWHTFTPELARAAEVDEERFAAAAGEPRSKVTFELEPAGSAVLTESAESRSVNTLSCCQNRCSMRGSSALGTLLPASFTRTQPDGIGLVTEGSEH